MSSHAHRCLTMMIWSHARWLLGMLLYCTTLFGASAQAQTSTLLSDTTNPLGDKLTTPAQMIEVLDESFSHRQRELLEEARNRAGDRLTDFDADAVMASSLQDFIRSVRGELLELEGDGSLTLGEVEDHVPDIRRRHLNRFADVVEARAVGLPPPPVASDSENFAERMLELGSYTLLTRNSGLSWLKTGLSALAGVVFAVLLSWGLSCLIEREDARQQFRSEKRLERMRIPLWLAAATAGLLVGLRYLWLPQTVTETIQEILVLSILVFALVATWHLTAVLAMPLAGVLSHHTEFPETHGQVLIKRGLWVLLIIVFAFMVTQLFFDGELTGIFATLGVLGVALWFLVNGLLKNLAASFTLFGDRVFDIGDIIIYDGQWGTIEDIGFRTTRFRNFDGHLILIPNFNLTEQSVHNVSATPHHRRRTRLSIPYGTTPEKLDEAIALVHEAIDEVGEDVSQAQGVYVLFDEFGAYDLQLLVQYYTSTSDYWGAHAVHDRINHGILRRFADAGIDFAYPTSKVELMDERESQENHHSHNEPP